MSQHATTFFAASVLPIVLLVGCSSDGDDSAPTTPSPSASSGPSDQTSTPPPDGAPADDSPSTPTTPGDTTPSSSGDGTEQQHTADDTHTPPPDQAAFDADTSPDTATASANAALALVDIRSGAHDGYDRVVLEYSGPGTPGWTAQYVDTATRQGSGQQIKVAGEALLDIAVTGGAHIGDVGVPVPTGELPLSGTSSITGLFNDGMFEGVTHVVLGTSGEQAFRIFALADPPRVVIDVQH